MKKITCTLTVEPRHTAAALGSGSLEVFATPAMVALMEGTAAALVNDLPPDYTTVGTAIDVLHLRASPVGETITCTATLVEQTGRVYVFEVFATDASGNKIGTATHKRVAVEIARFMKMGK